MGRYNMSMLTEEQAKEYAKNLRARRKEAKVTAGELAELVGVSSGYIYEIECGRAKPSPQLASRIEDAFGAKPRLDKVDENVLEDRKEYGNKLFHARMNKGYKRSLVAGALGIPVDVYVEYERGECSIPDSKKETLEKLLGIGEVVEEPPVTKETPVTFGIPVEDTPPVEIDVCDIILDHVKDLKVDVETQKRVWRYFMDMKMREEERRLFG